MQCSQCQRPAVVMLQNKIPLCVEHYVMLQRANAEQQKILAALMNYELDSIDETIGIPSYARIRMPQPVVNTGNTTVNQLNIDRSVIGVLNTGTIQNLNATISAIQDVDPTLTSELKKFVEVVSKNTELSQELRKEIIEQLSFLASQLFAQKEKRNTSVIKTVFSSIGVVLSSVNSLLGLWDKLKPMLEKYF